MSSSTLRDICFDCTDNKMIARFWAQVLGYPEPEVDSSGDPQESISINSPTGGIRI